MEHHKILLIECAKIKYKMKKVERFINTLSLKIIMVLKIDFNNPQILHGHLEQALPQCELSKVEGIFVGRRGGLVYELFTQPRLMATGVRANSMNDMAVIRTYWDAVQRYIQSS